MTPAELGAAAGELLAKRAGIPRLAVRYYVERMRKLGQLREAGHVRRHQLAEARDAAVRDAMASRRRRRP